MKNQGEKNTKTQKKTECPNMKSTHFFRWASFGCKAGDLGIFDPNVHPGGVFSGGAK